MKTHTPKIFICEFLQETNSFNPIKCGIDSFKARGILEGDELINSNGKAGYTLEGMIDTAKKQGYTLFAGLKMTSASAGPVNSKTVAEYFIKKNIELLKKAGKVDGLLVSLHGATLSDKSDDVCGDILESFRKAVGEDVVISVTCDLHGNITEKMAKNADYICGYQTYPHVDFFEVGQRAANLLVRHLNGKKAKMAYVSVPMMAPAHGYTTTKGLLSKLMKRGTAMVESGKILDFSIFQVQPWMDIKNIGSTVLVIADDEQVAKLTAKDLAKEEFKLREKLLGKELYEIDDVIKIALENDDEKPVVLVDSADSVNAGATGDSATVLAHLLPYKDTLKSAVTVIDEKAVDKAFKLGIGKVSDFTLGASIAPHLSKPVKVKDAYIKSLHDGKFMMFGPAERGKMRDLGKSVVLEVGKIMILVTNRGPNAGDLNYYRSFGIEPSLMNLVDVKTCTSFRAGYTPIASKICNTMTPGSAGPDLTKLPYKNLPKPYYPFDVIREKNISEVKCLR